ncbi:hypothetical protein CDAR_257151 [Caerostris darwini]|uniref:Uncharacterized protein n=1 Tax=Caerostris darwini TaxID=1538125 RepID=A0AAV4PY39_9ARAC|nr:hypothetical protein CDAR_257151 [Caerostris darwini]
MQIDIVKRRFFEAQIEERRMSQQKTTSRSPKHQNVCVFILSDQSFKQAFFPVDICPVGSRSAALTFSQGVAQGTPRGGGPPSFLAPTPYLPRRLGKPLGFSYCKKHFFFP